MLNSLLVAGHKSFEENFGIHFKRTHLYVDGLPYKAFFAENEALFLVISRACVSNETRNLQRVFRPGGGILLYIGYIGMCGAKGFRFFGRFGLKLGINYDHFGLKWGMLRLHIFYPAYF